jgi:hypothetical protein
MKSRWKILGESSTPAAMKIETAPSVSLAWT